jgi:hypothetical protein
MFILTASDQRQDIREKILSGNIIRIDTKPPKKIKYKAELQSSYQNENVVVLYLEMIYFSLVCTNNYHCYIASVNTKRDWLICSHVALDKCNVSRPGNK